MAIDVRLLQLSPVDNVLVVRQRLEAGDRVEINGVSVPIAAHLGLGQKLASAPVARGEKIVKYGAPIGRATEDIALGAHVHIHNVASDYTPTYALSGAEKKDA